MASTGSSVNCGGVVSMLVTICTAVVELPQASVALQLRVRVYSTGQMPDVCTWPRNTTVTRPEQLSLAVTIGTEGMKIHSAVIFGGLTNTGAVLSNTVMICVQVAELPQTSVER